MKDVIVVNLDDTIVDVTERIRESLGRIGKSVGNKTKRELEDIVRTLTKDEEHKFYEIFLDDKLVYLDDVNEKVLEFIKRYQEEVRLPIVIITGRPPKMESTFDIAKEMEEYGFDIDRVHVRLSMIPAEHYKAMIVRKFHYNPVAIFDDDYEVLKVLKGLYPQAKIFQIEDGEVKEWQ